MLTITLSRVRTFMGLLLFSICAAAFVWLNPGANNMYSFLWSPQFLPFRMAMLVCCLAFAAAYMILFVRALLSLPAVSVDQDAMTLSFVRKQCLSLSDIASVADQQRYILLRLKSGKTRRIAKITLRDRGDAQRLVSLLAQRVG